MNANSRQVGGAHYKNDTVPDHWDVVIALNWDYLIGNATKYLWRLGRKGDAEFGQCICSELKQIT